MTRPVRWIQIAAVVTTGMLAAGCGSTRTALHTNAAADVPAVPLDTSLATPGGTWATVVMGGSSAQHNNFWQVFNRSAGSTAWKLVTPPGTADNGGLVVAAGAGQSAITAFRPSQLLTYTPLSQTGDAGKSWSALGPLDTALASTPGSLAIRPGGSGLLALAANGAGQETAAGDANWTTLVSARTLAATPAGRECGLRALTAAAYTPSGLPMLAGACSHPGTAGIFFEEDGTWQLAMTAVPADLASGDIKVLRLVTTGSETTALLETDSDGHAAVFAAWSAGGGTWTMSAPLPLSGAGLASTSFGPGGEAAVLTTRGVAYVITSAGDPWHALAALPPGTATVALDGGDQADALAVHDSTLTVWHIPAGGTVWTRAEVISVPIEYGSSG
jgi:hypothetical protein